MQIIHLGIRKSGTSTFQQAVERACEAQAELTSGKQAILQWTRANGHNQANQKPDYAALRNILKTGADRHMIFSYERLAFYDQDELATVISEALPNAKILLTLRSPNSFLRSEFRHKIRDGHPYDVNAFSKQFTKSSLFKLLNVERYTRAFEKVGLREQLTILPYEWQADAGDSYFDFLSDFCGIDFHKYRLSYHVKKSPGRRFTELNRRVSELLEASAPEVLQSLEYRRFVKLASIAVAQTPDFEEMFGHFYEGIELDMREPEVPEDLWPELRARLEPLREIDVFKPYLKAYGIATEQKEP